MIERHNQVNIKFETYIFLDRWINRYDRYPKQFSALDYKKKIDHIYDEAQSLLSELHEEYKETMNLFEFFSQEIKVQSMCPYFEYYCNEHQDKDLKSTVYVYIEDLYENSVGEKPEPKSEVYFLVHSLDLEPKVKWTLLEFYEEAEAGYPLFVSLMEQVSNYLEPKLSDFQSELDAFKAEWETIEQRVGLTSFIFDQYNLVLPDLSFHLYPSIIGMNQGTFHNRDIYIGLKLNESLNQYTMNFEQACKIFKILGDPTKASILSKLRERSMYGKELASELNLTSATISYHMQELLNEQLITVISQETSNRIYYQVNQELLLEALEYTKEMFKQSV